MAEKKWTRIPNPRYRVENWSPEMRAAAIEATPSHAKKYTLGLYHYPDHEPWLEFQRKWMPLKDVEQHFVCVETGETVIHMVEGNQADEITNQPDSQMRNSHFDSLELTKKHYSELLDSYSELEDFCNRLKRENARLSDELRQLKAAK